MKEFKYISIIVLGIIASSCSSQRYVSSETDDIYYSASDRFASTQNEFSTVTEAEGSEYATQDDYKSSDNGYFVKGSSSKQNEQNPNSKNAYANSEQVTPTEFTVVNDSPASDGSTTNNYYGNTTVYSDDY